MPNYTDTENPIVKELWDLDSKTNKKISKFYWFGVAIFLLIIYLVFSDKLTTNILLVVVITGFFSLGWLIDKDIKILHKRIDIIDEAFDKEKHERIMKEWEEKESKK